MIENVKIFGFHCINEKDVLPLLMRKEIKIKIFLSEVPTLLMEVDIPLA